MYSSIRVYVYTLCCHVVLLCMLLLLSLLFVYESCCSSCFKHSLWLILTIMANHYSRYEYIYIYTSIHHASPMTTSLPWKHSRVSSNGSSVFVGGYCQPTTLVRSFGASPGAWIWRGDTVDTPSSGYIRIISQKNVCHAWDSWYFRLLQVA